jgi:hypothetical protein
MKDYIKSFKGFRWSTGVPVEAARLSSENIRGKKAVARLLLWNLTPDYRQRPREIAQASLDALMAALTVDEAKRIAVIMAHQLEDNGQ